MSRPRSAVPDRPKMHGSNVCKAVVESVCSGVFGRPDVELSRITVLSTRTWTSHHPYEFEISLSHPILAPCRSLEPTEGPVHDVPPRGVPNKEVDGRSLAFQILRYVELRASFLLLP